MDDAVLEELDLIQLEGILLALSSMMDNALSKDNDPRPFYMSLSGKANEVAKSSLKRFRNEDPNKLHSIVEKMAKGRALNWLVGHFFLNQLRRHGVIGDKAVHSDELEVLAEDLQAATDSLRLRLSQKEVQDQILSYPDISSFLYGWRHIGENDQAVEWVNDCCKSDENFLKILNSLRGWAMSSKVYYPLNKDTIDKFFDFNEVRNRLEELSARNNNERARDLLLAIKQGEH